jgi:hypothetical protein
MAKKCSECGDSMGGFFGTPESRVSPNVCVQCMNKRSAERKQQDSHSSQKKEANSDDFKSSISAISFLDIVNNICLCIGIFAALAVLIFAANISSGTMAIDSGLIFLASYIAWCVIRVLTGMAKDLRVSRDNSDQLLALAREKLESDSEQ